PSPGRSGPDAAPGRADRPARDVPDAPGPIAPPAPVRTTSGTDVPFPAGQDEGRPETASPPAPEETGTGTETETAQAQEPGPKGKGVDRGTDLAADQAPDGISDIFPVALAIDEARRDHDDALTAFNRAARTADLLSRRVGSGRGGNEDTARFHEAWQDVERSQRRIDAAVDRLRDLGADAAADAALAAIVPRVRRTDAERRRTAALITADDLTGAPPRLPADGTVTTAELTAGGVTPGEGLALQAELNGSVQVQDSGLDPVGHVRVLMNRPGPWSEALDAVAARAARRTWRSAYEDFALATFRASGVPTGTDPADAWRRAVSLVLPLELHPVLADSRHADAELRAAVRKVAEHLAVHGTDAVSGADLASRTRRELGLAPRLPGGAPGFSPAAPDHARAAAELERLALLDDPRGGFDVDSLARRVLHVPAGVQVSADHHGELFALVENAMAAGWASSVMSLGAYHLATGGLLDHGRHIVLADGSYQGLNLTDRPVGVVNTSEVWQRRDGRFQGPIEPLWDTDSGAYVIAATGDHEQVLVPWGQGELSVPWGEFVELVARDPGLAGLPPGVPVVLVLNRGGDQGLVMPRSLAFRTGRNGIWAHSGQVALVHDAETGFSRIVVENQRARNVPLGGWFGSDADDLGPDGVVDEGFVTALDGTVIPDSAVKSRTIAEEGRSVGRVTMSDADLVINEPVLEALDEVSGFSQFDPVTSREIGSAVPLLEDGRPVYRFSQHGMPMRGVMEVTDGRPPIQVDGVETGRFISRRPSMRKLGAGAVIDLGSCWADALAEDLPYLTDAATPPYVFDVLGMTSYAQGVANGSTAGVLAVDRVHAYQRTAAGPKAGAMAGPSGEQGAQVLLPPEPRGADLARTARWAGLHSGAGTVSPEDADATTRLVRALRRSFGGQVAADPEFRTLLRGAGALEMMRRADPHLRVAGPFTLHHLHLVVHARHQRTGNDAPTPDEIRAVLHDAARRADEAAAGQLTLHGYTQLPSFDWALRRLGGQDLSALAADVLRLPPGQAVTQADVSRLVWGTVKGAEALRGVPDPVAYARKVLHLPASAELSADEAGDRLLWLMAGAAVTGFDPSDPADLAAWDLVRNGALDDSTRLMTRGVAMGRNWTRRPVDGDINTQGYVLSPDGTVGNGAPYAPGWPGGPSGSPADAYVIYADSVNGHVSMPFPDGSNRWVPGSEIAALLRHDRVHRQLALAVPLLMVGTHTNPVGLARHVAGRSGTARTTVLSELPSAPVYDAARNGYVIVLAGDPAQPTAHWQTGQPAVLPGTSAEQGTMHTFAGGDRPAEPAPAVVAEGSRTAAPVVPAPAVAPPTVANADRELSPYVRAHGTRHDGHIGLVIHEPTPDSVLDGLHRQVILALGADPDSAAGQELRTTLSDVLSAEEVELNRPYLRSRQGHRITVRHDGRDRSVDVRLAYTGAVRSAKYGHNGDQPPATLPGMQVEYRASGGQTSSDAEGSGTFRTGSVPWTAVLPTDGTGPLRWLDGTLNLTATHNQLAESLTVGETFLVLNKQQAEDPAHPIDVDGQWQVQVDTDREDAVGNWQPEQSHGALTIWFHEHLAFDGSGTGEDLPEPGDVGDLPLWGVDSVAEPRRLLTEVLADDNFADLRDLPAGSERALENFLHEQMLRGTPQLQIDGGVSSPTLLDKNGNAIGMLQLTARIEPGEPLRKSPEGRALLETWLTHTSTLDRSAKFTAGLGAEVSGGPTFTTDRGAGHPRATESFGGNFLGRAGVNWQVNEALNTVESTTMTHGLRSKSSHLLTSARVTYDVTLHRAGGGRVTGRFGPWDDGLRLRIAQRSTMRGTRPTAEELREPPEHLKNLESVGYAETPLKVEGAEQMFARAEAWLRQEGFLPPAEARSRTNPFRLDEPLVLAQLENVRRLAQMRSRFGLATALADAVDGGQPVWFERPNTLTGTRRVQLRFSATGDTARPSVHERRLPEVHHVGLTSHEASGGRQRGTALSGSLGGGGALGIPVADGAWALNPGPEYLGTKQLTDASNTGDSVAYDQFILTSANGSELFRIPARLALDLYEGPGDDPLVRFADDAGADAEDGAEDAEGIVLPVAGAVPHTVPGTVTVLVPHYRTRTPDPVPAPAAPRAGHVIRQPVTDGGATDDYRRLDRVDGQGRPLPGLTKLPVGALVDTFRGTAALTEALGQIIAGTYPGHPEEGALGRAARRASAQLNDLATETARRGSAVKEALPASLTGAVNRVGAAAGWAATPVTWAARTSADGAAATYKWTSVAVAGASLNDQGTLATEARQGAIRPSQLISRAAQILDGVHVVEGLTLPGMAADRTMTLEIRGYLTNPRPLGSGSLYSEQDVNSGDTAGRQRAVGRVHQGSFQVTAVQAPPPPPERLVHQANPIGRYGHSRRTDDTSTVSSTTKVTHALEETGDKLWIVNDVTLLVTVKWGVRNVAGNAVGLGSYAPVTVAIDLARGVTYVAPAQSVARAAQWFQGMAGIPALTPPLPGVPLPTRFVRSRQLGKAGVLSVTQLDDTTNRRERRDRLGRELTVLVENEAPGSLQPGHAAYLPGVESEIARRTGPAGLRALPGRGPGGHTRLHFIHSAFGGVRLVEVTLRAEPILQTPALRGVRGRPAGEGGGLEQVDTHTPQARATASGVTKTRQLTVNVNSRYPRPGTTGRTDREGPALGLTTVRTRTARTDTATEDRFWTRTALGADFDLDYRVTGTVRSQLVWEWPPNIPGGVFQGGLLNLSGLEGDVVQRVRTWIHRLLNGRPERTITVPVATELRFVGSEATEPREHAGPRPPALLTRHPLGLSAADAAALGTLPFAGDARLLPTGPTPVHEANAVPQLMQALLQVAPRTAASWGLPANASAEAVAVRLGELIQSGEVSLDPARTAAGLTTTMPGSWPLQGPGTAPSLEIALYNPRSASDSGDGAVDRVRRQVRTSATTSSAGSSFALNLNHQSNFGLPSGNSQLVGFTFPLLAQQPHTNTSGGNASASRFTSVRTGTAAAPADRRGTHAHETLVDTVITVTGPEGTRYVTGSLTVRLWERDVLGFGVARPRPGPRIYDVPAMLAGQDADDLRDWARHPVTELPGVLADGIEEQDATAELWLALGPDPDGTRLARALFVGSRTAALAGRPVELVVRTDQGLRHWPFAADGSLADATQATRGAWEGIRDDVGNYLRAVGAEATARYREDATARRQPGALRALESAGRAVDTATTAHRAAELARAEA
ncbi:lonely Cys domain-containing protein, partial [Streptomyces sp. SID11233]|nr:lonely Cys domain-containing protein [Streptomyces sp. SID11233]